MSEKQRVGMDNFSICFFGENRLSVDYGNLPRFFSAKDDISSTHKVLYVKLCLPEDSLIVPSLPPDL